MKAVIFAAGLGTRLRPLTNTIPKALVPVNGVPLLQIAIQKLLQHGITDLVINVHHFADQIESFLNQHHHFGAQIQISDERAQVLETGGGLNKAKEWLKEEDFLVLNADVVSNIDLSALIDFHRKHQPIATLAIRKRVSSRYLLFNEDYRLVGWQNVKTDERRISVAQQLQAPFGFSGIQVISPRLFNYMPDEEQKFSIIDTYLEAAKREVILGYSHTQDIWLDVGKPEQLEKASAVFEEVYTPG